MKKNKFAKQVSEVTGMKTKKITEIVDDVFKLISNELRKGRAVQIESFGLFRLAEVKPKVIFLKNKMRKVIPPHNKIEFVTLPDLKNIHPEFFRDEEIKQALSIKYGLSIQETFNVVDNIFKTLSSMITDENDIRLKGFGKFKMKRPEEIFFTPSRKLVKKMNKAFNALDEVELTLPEEPEIPEFPIDDELSDVAIEKKPAIVKETAQRKLVSDTLLKLHKEITGDDNEEKKNLWG